MTQIVQDFVLLNEHVPVHFIEENGRYPVRFSTGFVCPLPLHYQVIIKEHVDWLATETQKIIETVDKESFEGKGSFVNIMLEYRERTLKDQERVRRLFGFSHILFSKERGLFSITAGSDCNSGDVYLDTNASNNYYEFLTLDGFKKNFEPRHAWYCHNVDFYWQALKTREITVRYYNLLRQKLAEISRVSK